MQAGWANKHEKTGVIFEFARIGQVVAIRRVANLLQVRVGSFYLVVQESN